MPLPPPRVRIVTLDGFAEVASTAQRPATPVLLRYATFFPTVSLFPISPFSYRLPSFGGTTGRNGSLVYTTE